MDRFSESSAKDLWVGRHFRYEADHVRKLRCHPGYKALGMGVDCFDDVDSRSAGLDVFLAGGQQSCGCLFHAVQPGLSRSVMHRFRGGNACLAESLPGDGRSAFDAGVVLFWLCLRNTISLNLAPNMSEPSRSFALAMVATLAWMITLLMPFTALHWLEKAAPMAGWRLCIVAWLV